MSTCETYFTHLNRRTLSQMFLGYSLTRSIIDRVISQENLRYVEKIFLFEYEPLCKTNKRICGSNSNEHQQSKSPNKNIQPRTKIIRVKEHKHTSSSRLTNVCRVVLRQFIINEFLQDIYISYKKLISTINTPFMFLLSIHMKISQEDKGERLNPSSNKISPLKVFTCFLALVSYPKVLNQKSP